MAYTYSATGQAQQTPRHPRGTITAGRARRMDYIVGQVWRAAKGNIGTQSINQNNIGGVHINEGQHKAVHSATQYNNGISTPSLGDR
jgi:hypothetical protein